MRGVRWISSGQRRGLMGCDSETFIREGIGKRDYVPQSVPTSVYPPPLPPSSATLPRVHPPFFVSVTELSPLTLHDDDDGYETTTATRLRSCHPASQLHCQPLSSVAPCTRAYARIGVERREIEKLLDHCSREEIQLAFSREFVNCVCRVIQLIRLISRGETGGKGRVAVERSSWMNWRYLR